MLTPLQELWACSCKASSKEQTVALGKTLIEFQDIFSKNDTDFGCFTAIKQKTNTGDAKAIRQRMNRTPLGFGKEHLEGLVYQV